MSLNSIGVRKMRVYLAAVEEGSFTRAAAKQNISQPAATIIVNQIEEEIGVELFQRFGASRKATLTPIGTRVAETFARIVAGYDSELAKINSISSGEREVIKVLVQVPFSSAISPRWISTFIEAFKDFKIEIGTANRKEIIEKVVSRDTKIGILDGTVPEESSDYVQLATFSYVLLVPTDLPDSAVWQKPIEWSDIPSFCYLLTGQSDFSVRRVKRNLREKSGSVVNTTDIGCPILLSQIILSTKSPAIVPDLVATIIAKETNANVRPILPELEETQVGMMVQWGHLATLPFGALRDTRIFDKENIFS